MIEDYEYAQLTDAEILEEEARRRAQREVEAMEWRRLEAKRRSFRFVGGM